MGDLHPFLYMDMKVIRTKLAHISTSEHARQGNVRCNCVALESWLEEGCDHLYSEDEGGEMQKDKLRSFLKATHGGMRLQGDSCVDRSLLSRNPGHTDQHAVGARVPSRASVAWGASCSS